MDSHQQRQSEGKGGERSLKATGIVRRVDELGRIVIPVELRRTYGIDEKDSLEIFTQADQIILRKYQPFCIFCGNAGDVVQFQGKSVCTGCRATLGQVPAGL